MKCSVVQEKCYKWHKINSGNNVTNDQRGPYSSHVLILSLHSTVITPLLHRYHGYNFSISNKKSATYDTVENSNYHFSPPVSFCIVNPENVEYLFSAHIANLSLNDEKFKFCIQD